MNNKERQRIYLEISSKYSRIPSRLLNPMFDEILDHNPTKDEENNFTGDLYKYYDNGQVYIMKKCSCGHFSRIHSKHFSRDIWTPIKNGNFNTLCNQCNRIKNISKVNSVFDKDENGNFIDNSDYAIKRRQIKIDNCKKGTEMIKLAFTKDKSGNYLYEELSD